MGRFVDIFLLRSPGSNNTSRNSGAKAKNVVSSRIASLENVAVVVSFLILINERLPSQ
jgi:hypothetical protein